MFHRSDKSNLLAWLDPFDLNKNASSNARTKASAPRYHLNSPSFGKLRSGALCGRLSSACAITVRSRARSTQLIAFLRQFFRATFGVGVLRGLPAMVSILPAKVGHSTSDLLLYQPCQTLTPPGASFGDYTHLKMESQAANFLYLTNLCNFGIFRNDRNKQKEIYD